MSPDFRYDLPDLPTDLTSQPVIIMPFTPFHFGPSAWLALYSRGKTDVLIFVLVNVVIDVEPLLVGLYWPCLWAHGYCHNLLIGSLVGFVFGIIAYFGRGILEILKRLLNLRYRTSFKKIVLSAILGVWFHIVLDALVESSIHPFFPLQINPFFGFIPPSLVIGIFSLCFIPITLIYISNYKKSTF